MNRFYQDANTGHYNVISGCVEKRGAQKLIYGDAGKGRTCYWNYIGDYWPGAGGPSVMNAIGTQLRDPIYSGLARWRLTV